MDISNFEEVWTNELRPYLTSLDYTQERMSLIKGVCQLAFLCGEKSGDMEAHKSFDRILDKLGKKNVA